MIQLGFLCDGRIVTGALDEDIESRSNWQPYEHGDKI